MDYQKVLDEMLEKISKRKKTPKLLLHVCCAPCSSYVLEYLSKYFEITLYYYNPNIEPVSEFDKRVEELKKLIEIMPLENKVNIVVEKYNNKEFHDAIKGYEKEKEGGERCFKCYRLRMGKAALYAKKNKFQYFTTTLSISPYKNANKLNEIGEKLEQEFGVKYLYADFKKKNGYKRSIELSKQYDLYRQDYCGCIYSKIEAEERRKEKENKKNIEDIMTIKSKKHKEDFVVDKKDYHSSFSVLKVLFILLFLAMGLFVLLQDKNKNIDVVNQNLTDINTDGIKVNEESAQIDEYYFYGNHFNIIGNLNVDGFEVIDANFILAGERFQYRYDLNFTITSTGIIFKAGDKLNNGLILDDINIDKYISYIEIIKDEDVSYYHLNNNTNYNDTIYYTVTENNFNKKLNFKNEENEFVLYVKKNEDKEIYDVAIDPGHGGEDPGACHNGICETDLTLELSNLLKNELENLGYKVKLTRETNDTLDKYGLDNRVDRSHRTKAKLLISIHLNSTSHVYDGFEIYTSNHIDYSFVRNMVNDYKNLNILPISNNTSFMVEPGIYTRTFTTTNVNDINSEVEHPYTDISTDTNYYFMIREIGGYMTGAYIDGQAGNGENYFRDTNVGLESYILELGYINNPQNVEEVKENKELYMRTLAHTIDTYFNS